MRAGTPRGFPPYLAAGDEERHHGAQDLTDFAAVLGKIGGIEVIAKGATFVVCIDNEGYEASLERNKIYIALADARARQSGDIRVIDESGEDYLFSARRFVGVELPDAVQASVRRAS
jgi:hypothetical protein